MPVAENTSRKVRELLSFCGRCRDHYNQSISDGGLIPSPKTSAPCKKHGNNLGTGGPQYRPKATTKTCV